MIQVPDSSQNPRPRTVLVIGGGPCGLVTLRNLLERGEFDQVQLVERRDDVGGVWYLDNPSPSAPASVPRWPSPAYPGLVGNVLPEFLSFSHFPFPPPSPQPFPTLAETHAYLRAFAAPLLSAGYIRLNTEVVRVEEKAEGDWSVVVKDWSEGGRETEEVWAAVVVATAWYDHPNWPATPGLAELREKGIARHAKFWRGPDAYQKKSVLVIGNANSSNDIAAQLAVVTRQPVYRSSRNPTREHFVFLSDPNIVDVVPVKQYSLSSPSSDVADVEVKATVELNDGRTLEGIDTVIVGTGYGVRVPFVTVLNTKSNEESSGRQDDSVRVSLTPDGLSPPRIPSLHKQILYAYNPTLAFIGAPVVGTPFVVADLSSTWLALAWGGALPYPPSPEERLLSEKTRLAQLQEARAEAQVNADGKVDSAFLAFHVLSGGTEVPYVQGLWADVVAARPALREVLPEWDEAKIARRTAMFGRKYESLLKTKEEGRGVGNLLHE